MTGYSVGYYVLFGVVLLPLYVMLAGWFTGHPRKPKTALLGLSYIGVIAIAILAGLWVMGGVLSLIIGV